MDGSYRAVVHRFGLSGGILQDRPRNTAVVVASSLPGLPRNRGDMFLLVEVLGALPDPGSVIERLIETIESQYYSATGSITGGISAALRAANDLLFEENLSSPREQRGVAGVSCAVLREGDLYLGQVGPALAYLALSDGLRRFPEDSPWLRQEIPGEADRAAWPPLGVRRVIEPQLYHATPVAGDALMLASPVLARVLQGHVVASAMAQGGAAGTERLRKLLGAETANVLMVNLVAETRAPAKAGDEEAAATGEEAAEGEWEPEESPQSAPEIRVGDQVRGLLGRVGQVLLTLFRGLLPERGVEPPAIRPKPVPRQGLSIRTLAILAALIPILVFAFVAIARYQYEQSRRSQVTDLLRQASEARNRAASASQKAAQRDSLQQALTLIDQALQVAPEDSDARKLRDAVVDQLDATSGVQRLYTLWELADLPPAGTVAAEPTRILVRGRDLFVLDPAGDRVFHRVLTPAADALEPQTSNPVLVQKGEQRGPIVVGELLDMVWMPAGGERKTPGLLIQERSGTLLEWTSGPSLAVLPVANSATWRKPQASGAYNGMYYILDPAQSRILRYMPSAGGYTAPPQDYFPAAPEADLGGAVDMAIDGHIYVLLGDGNILKFLSGKRQPFNIAELDTPLKNPVAIFVTGEDESKGFLYVADAGLARVVQFTKQGQFVRQLKAAPGKVELGQLRGLYVDEARQRIFLASGTKVYAAQLPQQGAAPVPTAAPTSTR